MTERKRYLPIAAIAAVALVAAACSDNDRTPVAAVDKPPVETPDTPPPPEMTTPSTEQERFDARIAVNNADRAKNAAVMAVPADVTAATTAMGKAAMYATNASDAADRAADARTDAVNASKASTTAGTHSTTAGTEKGKADAAQTALNNAIAAYTTAVDGQDIDTQDGAVAIKNAADALEKAANKAKMDAEAARKAAETARDDAKKYAGKAETAEDTHVVGLLIAANGQDITEPILDDSATAEVDESETVAEQQEAAAGRSAMAVETAAGEADNGEAGTTATAMWPADTADDPATADTDESATGMLSIMVDPEDSNTPMTFRTAAVEADPDADPQVVAAPKTAGNIAGLGDFNGFSISDGTRHAIVFTDKMQGTPEVTEVEGIEPQTLANAAAAGGTVTVLGTASGTGFTGVTFYASGVTVNDETDSELAFMGSLSCPDGTACTAETNADGTFTITGYVFGGSRDGRAAVENAAAAENDNYLTFGVWMQDDEVLAVDGMVTTPSDFGAFAAGGSPVTTVAVEVTGTATYEGSATGLYTAGSSVDYFQGDATLTADFGNATDTAVGTITGMIDEIVAGGVDMSDVIHLNDDGTPDDGNIDGNAGTFSGDARMGESTTVDAVTTYTHNGSWSGQFYNGTADVEDTDADESLVAPGSVAGTFGVTGETGTGDDAVTRSYVGAFGAHK